MSYVDGIVAAVPKANKDEYIEHSKYVSVLLKEYGALQQVECWGDDVPDGKLTSFPLAVQKEPDEVVVLSWIVWPSKEARDQGWEDMVKDERMNPESAPLPFDGKRMIFGGFEMIFEA